MDNPIITKCRQLHVEGYRINAVTLTVTGNTIDAAICLSNMVPLGEGGDAPHHKITIDRDNVPAGVTVGGCERVEDVHVSVPGNAEQADAMIREIASVGGAIDWRRTDNRWLTKPNNWR